MTYNILNFGAVSDGTTLNTIAIQSAIDACAANGGGTVLIPAGIYKTGTIWLRSNTELHLELGAILLASDNMDDYNAEDAYEQNFSYPELEKWLGKHLIIAHEIENAAITGLGKVDGNCYAFLNDWPEGAYKYGWRDGMTMCKDMEKLCPGPLIAFVECRHITVQDITVYNAPCWCMLLHGCEYVNIRGYKAFNPINMLHSDGIDIDTCRFVTVSDCIIETGDDAITLRCNEKPLKNKNIHCEYVTITNCVFTTGICAFRIGVGVGKVRHARISNISIERCLNIVQFCTAYCGEDCADIEDVNFSGISATDTDRCFEVFARNGGTVRNITMENIRTTSTAMNYIDASNGVIENFAIRNVEISMFDRYMELDEDECNRRGSHLMLIRKASGVTLDNVIVSGSLCRCDGQVFIEDCPGIIKHNCNL